MSDSPPSNAAAAGLNCLVIVARLLGVSANLATLRHEFTPNGEAASEDDILRAAKSLRLKAGIRTIAWNRLSRVAFPAIAINKTGRFSIIAGVSQDKVLLQYPAETRPRTESRESFLANWTGRLILFARRPGRVAGETRFGIRWFVPALAEHKKLFAEVLLASFFIQLFVLITPLFFQVVIDKVLVHQGISTLDVLAIGLLLVALFEVVLTAMRNYILAHTTNRIDVMLGARLFGHLLKLPMAYFEARRVGDSVARVRELENIRNFLTGSTVTLVLDLLFTIIFFAVLYLYSPLLTLVVAGAVPAFVLLSGAVTPLLRASLEEKFERGAENQAFLVESVHGMQTLKSMAVEPQFQRRWEEQLAAYVHSSFRVSNLGSIAGQAAGLVSKITTVMIIWVGATLVIDGSLTVGQLVAFNMIAGRINGPILRIVQLWQEFQQAGLSIRRLGDILNTPTESGTALTRTQLPALRGEIRFEHLSFRYRPDRPTVLQDISLCIRPGEVIGVVGHSGCGKSTLAKLIQRMYAPESGRLLVDGVDLTLVEPNWLRRRVSAVEQESCLFSRSIRENIALAVPGASIEQVVEAAILAGAHDFILELAEGYDTLVDENGSNLSGGQRQRIALARALITKPSILILDEATSALDYESEKKIQQNMRSICRNRTVIIIAHRLSTIRQADRILVLDKGKITEQGSHTELVERGGRYARLYALQSTLDLPEPEGTPQRSWKKLDAAGEQA